MHSTILRICDHLLSNLQCLHQMRNTHLLTLPTFACVRALLFIFLIKIPYNSSLSLVLKWCALIISQYYSETVSG